MEIEKIKKIVGQMFMIGFKGEGIPDFTAKLMKECCIGNVIFFKDNCVLPAQIGELSDEVQSIVRPLHGVPAFIAIDHEGGRINRLPKPFTQFPSAEMLGIQNSPKLGFDLGFAMATELRAVGINMNLAPVIDVFSNPDNKVIGDRSFGSDPEIVANMGSALIRGLQKGNVVACAKHFPGHGDTKVDSHLDLPKIEKTAEQLAQLEFIPFRRVIRSKVDAIMTAHILNPTIDPEYPATLSKKTISQILEYDLRFNKIVISDAMEMKAIANNFPADKAAKLAVAAGCNIVLYGQADENMIRTAYESVVKAVEANEIVPSFIEEQVAIINEVKRRYLEPYKPCDVTKIRESVGIPAHQTVADLLSKRG